MMTSLNNAIGELREGSAKLDECKDLLESDGLMAEDLETLKSYVDEARRLLDQHKTTITAHYS